MSTYIIPVMPTGGFLFNRISRVIDTKPGVVDLRGAIFSGKIGIEFR